MNVTFVTRLHKAIVNKEEKSPVVLQISWGTKVRRKRIGIWVKKEQFYVDEDKVGRFINVSGKSNKQEKANLYLKYSNRIIEDYFENREFNYKDFSILLDEKLEKISSSKKEIGVAEFCMTVSKNFLLRDQTRSSNDYRQLSFLILKISPKDISFESFDIDWLKKLERYLDSRGTKGFNYMNMLKVLYGKAVEDRVADFKKNPFKNPYTNPYGFDLRKFKKRRISKKNTKRIKDLSLTQLKELKNYVPTSEKEAEYLDVFWFSFYSFGVNITDLANLKKSDIRENRWYYNRSKTGVGLKNGKPLLSESLKIIDRWINKNPKSKYVFPILNENYETSQLKKDNRIRDYAGFIRKMAVRVSKRLNWEGYFTYYSARYSSATLALNSGADRNTVSHLLDHSNLSTIDHYAGRADDRKILEAMDLLRF